jgi:hypothetical protein
MYRSDIVLITPMMASQWLSLDGQPEAEQERVASYVETLKTGVGPSLLGVFVELDHLNRVVCGINILTAIVVANVGAYLPFHRRPVPRKDVCAPDPGKADPAHECLWRVAGYDPKARTYKLLLGLVRAPSRDVALTLAQHKYKEYRDISIRGEPIADRHVE